MNKWLNAKVNKWRMKTVYQGEGEPYITVFLWRKRWICCSGLHLSDFLLSRIHLKPSCTLFQATFQTPCSSICNNHLFLPSNLDPAFTLWSERGLAHFSDLYLEGSFATFNDLHIKYNLPQSHLFRYFQAHNFACTYFTSFSGLPAGRRSLTWAHIILRCGPLWWLEVTGSRSFSLIWQTNGGKRH